jgi:hypothetical protein
LRTFLCHCGNKLHYENNRCAACDLIVGYLPDEMQLSALEPVRKGDWIALFNNNHYRQCKNYSDYDVCNWMVSVNDNQLFCTSCRLNQIIPNLNKDKNITLWYRLEQAKRRLLYTLFSLNLPVVNRATDPNKGMGFEFLEDETTQDDYSNELTIKRTIVTGHSTGLITINLLEAEHSAREKMREKMQESYRTLLGHFRHESGHYYWDRLICGSPNITSFRELFGDERLDYTLALKVFYDQGPPEFWQNVWISAYASMHPWEDWAETWAHYLHMVDTLETAGDFGFEIEGLPVTDSPTYTQKKMHYTAPATFDELFNNWCHLSSALNALNRSMGLPNAYPFVISLLALNKLRYIHQIVIEAGS